MAWACLFELGWTLRCHATVLVAAAAFQLSAGSQNGVARAEGVLLLVRDQDTPHDISLLRGLIAEVTRAGWPQDSVVSMSSMERKFGHRGLWSYKPWIFQLHKQLQRARRRVLGGQRWFVFVEPTTAVDAQRLAALLEAYDSREALYIGRALRDETSSILHSYSQEPAYPLVHAGFALSGALLGRLARDLQARPLGGQPHHPQQIEPVFELAQWIAGLGVRLTDESGALCAARSPGCATWATQRRSHRGSWGLGAQDVVIGVKTVGKFHGTRIQHVHDFWAASSRAEVLYLSNEAFTGVPGATVIDLSPEFGSLVDPAKESTKQGSGHCSKMQAILMYFAQHRPGKRWYVVTDDDTLLNMPRLLEVLDSYDDSKAIYLGERYGWAHREELEGTNYITTGGGMALTGPALAKVMACQECTCHMQSSPDDMTLGSWFRSLRVHAIHEEGFHQAEPHNYHKEILRYADPPVSFHRFAVRLPAQASAMEKAAERRRNWQEWVRDYFNPARWSEEL